jgi:P4 family phage/plasmid primase-like protien
MSANHSIAALAALLNGRMRDLAQELLGAPNPNLSTMRQLRYGNKGSLAIEIEGEKIGTWYDHEHGVGGDGLELIRHTLKLHNGATYDWARNWLGLPSQKPDIKTATSPDVKQNKNLSPKQRAEKVADIIAGCCDTIEGTPAEFYLKRRGITIPPPVSIRFRPYAWGSIGAMVALATDNNGNVLALQQIYLTADGKKADLEVVKRTNKAVDKWAEQASVRLPGNTPLVLAEGVETALSIWQATGHETWACLGVSNMSRAAVPEGADVIIARDGDVPGSKADRQIKQVVAKLQARGHKILVAAPPEGKDFNDLLQLEGAGVVRTLIADAKPLETVGIGNASGARMVYIGSDVEISGRVKEDLIERYGKIVHAEGAFWRYGTSHWEAIADHELRLASHIYDGAQYKSPADETCVVKLGKTRIDSILHELATLVTDKDFFVQPPIGINCASGFIRFTVDGQPRVEPHSPDHRCRHTLTAKWNELRALSPDTLLHKLLTGVFLGDADADDKIQLLGEIFGAAALGYATKLLQPRATVLKGERAENGKSQILDLARGLLPASAICSVTAARMGDERHIVGLVGKLLNASDELSSSAAIASETFKAIVTGEPVEGRDVYKSRIEFRPIAQHIFATNTLPPFQGGMDRGVQRRLLVITFNRVIPLEERIEGIGRRIATEEADHLLAFAVSGASRLIRQRNFTIPASSKVALTDWILGADPVLAWLAECVEIKPHVNGFPNMATRAAYDRFHVWAVAEGFNRDKLPAINGFVQRVLANGTGIESKRMNTGRIFLGLTLKHDEVSSYASRYDMGRDA